MKYAISAIANIVAASGAMGRRVAIDAKYNIFVNTQGHYSLHWPTSHLAITRYLEKYLVPNEINICLVRFKFISGFILSTSDPGESHTNLHCDLHVEHANLTFKEGLKNAGGFDHLTNWPSHQLAISPIGYLTN